MGVVYGEAVRTEICTESEALAERLRALLARWACGECVALSVRQTKDPAQPANGGAQLLFLDMDTVPLPSVPPMQKGKTGLIVISRDAGRAIRSYRWHPAAFLKPDLDLRRLTEAMNACEKSWLSGRLVLESPYRRRSFFLPLGKLRRVEAAAHYCLFDQGREAVRLRFSIDELEKLLPGPPFARCHRSYLVHLGAVEGMSYTAVFLRGGIELPLGRSYVRSLRTALQAWQRGETQNDDPGPRM